MNKVLAIVAAVALALVAVVLFLPHVLDWNSYRPQIADRISLLVDEPVRIDGSVEFRLLPRPVFSATDVTLGEAEQAGTAERVEATLAFWPLVQGEVEARSLSVVRPVIRASLDRLDLQDLAGVLDRGAFAAAPENLLVRDGTLHLDSGGETFETVRGVNLQLSRGRAGGSYEATGDLIVDGQPVTVSAEIGSVTGGEAPVSLQFRLPASDTRGSLYGRFTSEDKVRFVGETEIESPDASALSSLLPSGPKAALSDQGQGVALPLRLRAGVEAGGGVIELEDLSVDVAGILARASAILSRSADGIRVQVEARVGRVDLDRAGVTRGGVRPGPYLLAAQRLAETGVSGTFDLAAEAVLVGGGVVRNAAVLVSLENGAVAIERFSADLPGAANLLVAGTVEAAGPEPKFALSLQADARNLRRTLEWSGYALQDVPAGRLRSGSVSANLASDGSRMTISDIVAELDGSNFRGGLTVSLGERTAFAVSAAVDRADIDAYFPETAERGLSGFVAAVGGLAPSRSLPSLLSEFDANVHVRVDHMTVGGAQVRGAILDALLFGGRLDLRELGYERAFETKARLSGRLLDLGRDPSGTLGFRVEFEDLAGTLSDLSFPDSGLLGAGGAVAAEGSVSGSLSDLALKVSLDGERLDGAIEGRLRGAPEEPRYEIDVELLSGEQPGAGSDALSIAFRVQGGMRAAMFREITVEKDGPLLTGRAAVDWSGARPVVQATLRAGQIAPRQIGLTDGETPRGFPRALIQFLPWLIEQKADDLKALQALDVELAFGAASIGLSTATQIEGVELSASLSDGVLDLRRLEGRYAGGTFGVAGRLATPGRPVFSISIRVDGAETDALGLVSENLTLSGGTFDLALTIGSPGPAAAGGRDRYESRGTFEARNGSLTVAPHSGATDLVAGDAFPDVVGYRLLKTPFEVADGNLVAPDVGLVGPRGEAEGSVRVDLVERTLAGKIAFTSGELAGALLDVAGRLDRPRVTLGPTAGR